MVAMTTTSTTPRVALITGGTAGLGLALTRSLAADGWHVITDGRTASRVDALSSLDGVTAIAGDVTDPAHRRALADAVPGRLDLLVHNASTLGPLPLSPLSRLAGDDLAAIVATNLIAAHELNRLLVGVLAESDGILLSLSSDAAVEHYETWGGYGASKAALDHLTLTTAAENGVPGYTVDPGDMRTAMHQDAFPGEDISDRPLPETVVPHLRALLAQRPASARYRAGEFA